MMKGPSHAGAAPSRSAPIDRPTPERRGIRLTARRRRQYRLAGLVLGVQLFDLRDKAIAGIGRQDTIRIVLGHEHPGEVRALRGAQAAG